MSKIDAKYLTKVYKNGAYGLKNCSVSVREGEFLVIVGASGSGKSTLLKVLSGTEELSSGELYIDGILAENIPVSKRNISMVFQEYLLYPHLTVFENLATPLKLAGEDEKSIYDRVMDTLRMFDLQLAADVKPKNLSGGEQQRVALAKALLKKSRLLLLDEPLSNVDEKSRWEYCATLKKMKRMMPDSTFIYVTHNVSEAVYLADRIAVMQDGAISKVAPASLLLKYPCLISSLEIMGKADNRFNGIFDGNGFVCDKDLSEFSLPRIDYSTLTKNQPVIFVISSVEENALHIFDEKGRTIALPSDKLTFDGMLTEGVLEFANQSLRLNEEYFSRLLYYYDSVKVELDIEKFSKSLLSDSFSLVAVVVDNCGDHLVLKIGDKGFIMNRRTDLKSGEKIRLYYKTEDLILYYGDDRLTCHYPLKRQVDARVIDAERGLIIILGKRIKLNKSVSCTVGYAKITESGFQLSYTKGKYAISVCGCLDEEFINGKKLNYIATKKLDSYITVLSGKDISCLGNRRVWLNIIPDGLELEEKR